MAKIVKSNLQLEALKFVNDGIKLIEKINKMLRETDVEKCALNVKINSGRVSLDDYDFIIKVLHSLKRDIFNKIKRKCNKFSIELDEKDKEILGIIEKEIEAEMEQGLEAVETEEQETAEDLEVEETELEQQEDQEQEASGEEMSENLETEEQEDSDEASEESQEQEVQDIVEEISEDRQADDEEEIDLYGSDDSDDENNESYSENDYNNTYY